MDLILTKIPCCFRICLILLAVIVIDMLENQFKKYVFEQLLLEEGSKVVAAISGGIDSMAMLHLLAGLKLQLHVAHCNFRLRGKESDGDEAFIRDFCVQNNLQVKVKHFDTTTYAKQNQISVQMAARELRYRWFEELRQEIAYDFIAIAHNLDDAIETVFLNLARGTGIRGISGIKIRSGAVIRPLLFASRNEIYLYAIENNIEFREDSSNLSVKYKRNQIRHTVIPGFLKLNPSFQETMRSNMDRFAEIEELVTEIILKEKEKITSKSGEGELRMNIKQLRETKAPKTVLFEIIQPYGFSATVVTDVLENIGSQPGKVFYSSTHVILLDRDDLILREKVNMVDQEFVLEQGSTEISFPIKMKMNIFDRTEEFAVSGKRNVAELDADTLIFPLKIRRWHEGDYFYPLGMKGKKKLSDFFIDNKFTRFDKENCWLLISGDAVVWVISHRIDNRFKIISTTKQICRLTIM